MVLQPVDFTEDGALLQFDLSLGEIRLFLPKVGRSFFGVGAVLSPLLFNLVAKIVNLSLSVASVIGLLGAVKRGDQVKRGQVIARSGQSGNVNAPQLHFEIRKGASPVDPTKFLKLVHHQNQQYKRRGGRM